jgi:hypothetical protein
MNWYGPQSCHCECDEEIEEACIDNSCVDKNWEWGVKICNLTLNTTNAPSGAADNSLITSDLTNLWVTFSAPGGTGGNVGQVTASNITGTGYTLQISGYSIEVSAVDLTMFFGVTSGCTRDQNIRLEFLSRVVGSGCSYHRFAVAAMITNTLPNCEISDATSYASGYATNDLIFGVCNLRSIGAFLSAASMKVRRDILYVSDPGC